MRKGREGCGAMTEGKEVERSLKEKVEAEDERWKERFGVKGI